MHVRFMQMAYVPDGYGKNGMFMLLCLYLTIYIYTDQQMQSLQSQQQHQQSQQSITTTPAITAITATTPAIAITVCYVTLFIFLC